MKKIYALLSVMTLGLAANYATAEPLLTPDPAKTYMIQHSSGYFFTISGGAAKIASPGEGTQKFTFVPVEGVENTYNIKIDESSYVGSDDAYTVKVLSDPTDKHTQFTFWECTEVDHVKMWNEGRGGYFGTDQNNDGSGVYSDKVGNDGKHAWRFVEAPEGFITEVLQTTVNNARAFLEDTPVGENFSQAGFDFLNGAVNTAAGVLASPSDQSQINEANASLVASFNAVRNLYNTIVSVREYLASAEVGETTGAYPQSAADALNAALSEAVAAYATDAAGMVAAVSPLNAARQTFDSTQYVFVPEAGKQYIFINTFSNYALGVNGNGEAALAALNGAVTQRFEIVPVEGMNVAFNLKRADDGGFLAVKGGWNSTTVSDPTADAAKIFFGVVDLENKIYTLNRLNFGGAWATDSNNEGSLVYTNKSQRQENAQWQIIEYVEGQVFTMALEKAITNAENYIANSVIGDQPGQYPQENLDALKTALATAKAATYTTQEEVDAVTAALNAAISEFLASKIDPFFVPEENTTYRFSVRKYADKFMTAGDDKVGTSEYEAGNALQQWTFVPVADAKYTYIVKNGTRVLNYDGTLTETADAEAPKWTAKYLTTVDNLDRFALVQYDDPTKCITFGSGKNFAVQNLDKGNNAHQGYFLRVDAANDPNVLALDQAVANALATLKGVVRGNEIGQYSDAKCNAFEAVIAEIKALRGLTQEEVAAKAAELNQAAKDFKNNPNSVIKDEFDAAIAAGKAKAEAAEIGIEVGQFYPSQIKAFLAQIADFEERGKAVTEQEACDALTEEVKTANDAFTGNTEVQPVADVLADVITWCEELYEAEKDNVGDNKGQRPQAVVDAYAAAIAKAKALTAPEVTDLQALLDAREAFLSGAVSQNRTPIRKAIAEAEGEEFANLVAGEFNGNYPQEAIDTFKAALAAAKAAEADTTKTQEELDAATKALNDAMAALRKAVVTIKFTDFDAAIAAAEAAVAKATVVGSEAGQCPQAVVDALTAVINKAKAIDRAAVTQATVDELAAELGNATAKFNEDLVTSTGLADAIDAANEVLEGATAGFKPGNYPTAAIGNLKAAIEAALLVQLNNASTQAELIEAVGTLNAAVEAFKKEVVPAHDLTAINATIAEAEAFIAEHGNGDFVLAMALEDAKAVVENPDDYTKAQVDKANSDLRKALDFAKEQVGIDGIYTGELSISAADGNIVVKGLSAGTTVAVYTLEGRMVALTETSAPVYTLSVGAGKYVVALKGASVAQSAVVIVK